MYFYRKFTHCCVQKFEEKCEITGLVHNCHITKQSHRGSLQQRSPSNLPGSACRNPVGAVRHESSADLKQMFLPRRVAQI